MNPENFETNCSCLEVKVEMRDSTVALTFIEQKKNFVRVKDNLSATCFTVHKRKALDVPFQLRKTGPLKSQFGSFHVLLPLDLRSIQV